ncbi:MAG: threonine ammonia-lyase, partial [Thiovulaceae bacterium]|nr:threonine ammonia-lyase [Sulfurimonadaceae bacterium]
ITVTLIDKPGSLKRFTEILEELSANIVHISYDRTAISLDYGDANVTVHMETKGPEHQNEIIDRLKKEGYLRNQNI